MVDIYIQCLRKRTLRHFIWIPPLAILVLQERGKRPIKAANWAPRMASLVSSRRPLSLNGFGGKDAIGARLANSHDNCSSFLIQFEQQLWLIVAGIPYVNTKE